MAGAAPARAGSPVRRALEHPAAAGVTGDDELVASLAVDKKV